MSDYVVRKHAFGRDPQVTETHRYLDNAKASVFHAVRCYGLSRNFTSILGPDGKVYTLNSLDVWVETPKL